MAVSNSAINIVLSAVDQYSSELDKFDKKVNKSAKGVERFAKSMKLAAKAVGGLAAGLGSAAFFAGIARLKTLTETARELDALSLVTGESIQDLNTMATAMRLVGGESDVMGENIREFNLRMGEATAKGTGPFVEALDALNLSLKDLVSMDAEDQFRAIAEAMEALPAAEQMFVLDRLFGGSGGAEMAKVLADGVENYDELIRKSKELSSSLDDDVAQSLMDLSDAVNELSVSFMSLFDDLLFDIVDTVREAIDNIRILREMAEGGTGQGGAMTSMQGELGVNVRQGMARAAAGAVNWMMSGSMTPFEGSPSERFKEVVNAWAEEARRETNQFYDRRHALDRELAQQREKRENERIERQEKQRKRMMERLEKREMESIEGRRKAAERLFLGQAKFASNERAIEQLMTNLNVGRSLLPDGPETERGRTAALGSFGAGERFLQTGASLTETWSERMVDNTAAIADINADIKKTNDEIKRLQKEQVRLLQTSLPNLVIQGVGA